MRWWITKSGSSYVAPVAGIELYGSFGEVSDRAFGPLGVFIGGANRSRRQIAMSAPVTQQNAGPEKIAMAAPVVQQTGGQPGSRGRPVSFDFGDPQLEHGYDSDRAYRTPS
jgi:hypothetical protein